MIRSTRATAIGLAACLAAGACSAPSGGSLATPAATDLSVASASPSGTAAAPVASPSSRAADAPRYTIDQATSDKAQLTTIAFDALGFLTGNLGADSFFPPGKVADFWGFQYLRDNDPSAMGHNTDFLTRASLDTLAVLTTAQRARLIELARSQVDAIAKYGYDRFTLMAAFRRSLASELPAGAAGLDPDAVAAYSATLYRLDGEISLARAEVMGPMLAALTNEQRSALDAMVGTGMTTWPAASEPSDLAGLSRDEKVAVMTYAGDLFSWYAGDIEADVYFCPERHGTYFGSFYLKDAPAVGNPGYSIDTRLTADFGSALLAKLDAAQGKLITGLVDDQRTLLAGIVDARRAVATQLRTLRTGGTVDRDAIARLMTTYGELDGRLSALYAAAFVAVDRTLTDAQRAGLLSLRQELLGTLALPTGAFLYSQPIPLPSVASTDFLFR